MGGKGDLDISGRPAGEPQDDYIHMSEILPGDFPIFSDGAGEVEEFFASGGEQNIFTDGTYWYFQSSFDFNTFPQSDGFFGFTLDSIYADRVNTLIEVVTLGDYFIDFTTSRVYSHDAQQPTNGHYVHICEKQLLVRGGGPLTDFDYEVITELYPDHSPPEDPGPAGNSEYMFNELIRWESGDLLAHTANGIFSRIYGEWLYYGVGFIGMGIMYSSDNGVTWAKPTFTGSVTYPHLGRMIPYDYFLTNHTPVFQYGKDVKVVLAKLNDEDWDVPGPVHRRCQIWISLNGGADFIQGYNMQDHAPASYGTIRWDGNTVMARDTLALDQRYRIPGSFTDYVFEHGCFFYAASGTAAEFWHVSRVGLGGLIPVHKWQAPGGLQAGQCRSVLVGNDNHMLFTTNTGQLWKSINHAAPVLLVDNWPDLYPPAHAGLGSNSIYPFTFTPETDDIWVWNPRFNSGAAHLWHSSDAGVTWTWLTNPDNGGHAPTFHDYGGVIIGKGVGLIRLSENKFLTMISHWPRNIAFWLSEDGGVTWSSIVTYPGFGFQTPDSGWPYPDPLTSTKFTAAEGNNGGLRFFSNFEVEGIREGNDTEFYLWCGAAAAEYHDINHPEWEAQDEVMRLMRIHIFPGDAVIESICDEAGFIIRARHVNDLRTKLGQLNSNVRTGGTSKVNFGIDFTAMTAAGLPVTSYKDHIRAPHYEALVTEFTGVAGQVGTSPAGEWYTANDVDLGDFLSLIVPPVAGDPPYIRTLIAMRKIIQSLYTDGYYCACFSFCPCQTDIQYDISGGKK